MKNSSLTHGVTNCIINGSSTRVFKYFNGALSCFNWMVVNVWECAARECLFYFYFFSFCPFSFFPFMFCADRTETLERVAVPFTIRSRLLRSRDVELIQMTGKFGPDINKCFLPACLPGSLDFEKKENKQKKNVNVFSLGKKKKKRFVSCRLSEDAVQFCVILNEWLSILLCLCVFLRLFVFALWNFLGKLTCISDVFFCFFFLSACARHLHTRRPWVTKTLITKSV